ncbi:Superkiller protein 3 [Dispira simplex]|nr:Superkiller protein 3 [Dispira simplex]
MSSKSRLKQAKEALGKQDYPMAQRLARGIVEFEPSNYTAWVFLGVACQHLEQWDDCKEAYQRAIEVDPTALLAWQGLCAYHEKQGQTEAFVEVATKVCDLLAQANQADKLWTLLHKLCQLAEDAQDIPLCIQRWKLATLAGPYGTVLAKVTTGRPTESDIWFRIIDWQLNLDERTIKREINSRRTRLGAEPLVILSAKVEKEVMDRSELLTYCKQWLGAYQAGVADTSTDDLSPPALHVHLIYFERLHRQLRLSSPPKHDLRNQVLEEATLLCRHHASATAFEFLFITADVPALDALPIDLLRDYVTYFPEAILAPFAQVLLSSVEPTTPPTPAELFDQAITHLTALSGTHHWALLVCAHFASLSGDHQSALGYANRALPLLDQFATEMDLPLRNIRHQIQLLLADNYRQLGRRYYGEAEEVYQTILKDRPESFPAKVGLALVYNGAGKFAQSVNLLTEVVRQEPENSVILGELGWVYYQNSTYDQALELLRQAVDKGFDNAVYHYRLGCVYWALDGVYRTDQQYAFSAWLRAAQLNPSDGEVFYRLGVFFDQVEGDPDKAAECYYQAFRLDATHPQAPRALVHYCHQKDLLPLADKVVRAVVEANPQAAWAWQTLGFTRLRQGTYREAISAFQRAIRVEDEDALSWEGLGEAYYGSGSYVSALNALQRAHQRNPTAFFPAYLLGKIHSLMKTYAEALDFYTLAEEALQRDSTHDDHPSVSSRDPVVGTALVVAHARTHLGLARQYITGSFYARAADQVVQAMHLCQSHIERVPEGFLRDPLVVGVWEVSAELCRFYRSLGDYALEMFPLATLQVLGSYVLKHYDLHFEQALEQDLLSHYLHQSTKLSEFTSDQFIECCEVFACAMTRAQLALVNPINSPEQAGNVYYQLAKGCYGLHAQEVRNDPFRTSFGRKKTVLSEQDQHPWLREAVRACGTALQLQPQQSEYWSALGTFLLQTEPRLAQHALVKALLLQPADTQAWCNLGYLYLVHGETVLANKAFGRAQSASPDYASAWIGQALLAQTLNVKEEALELFYHTFILSEGTNLEVNRLFGTHWFRHYGKGDSLESPTGSSWNTAALFAMHQVVERSTQDPWSLTLLGLLLERHGRYTNAADVLRRALAAVRALPDSTKSSTSGDEERIRGLSQSILAHLARVLCAAGDYQTSVEMYSTYLAEVNFSGTLDIPTLAVILGKGLAEYFQQDLGSSLESFELALRLAETHPTWYQETSVLLAQVLWALGTDDHRQLAKQQLLQTVGDAGESNAGTPSPRLLFTLFAMAMCEPDPTLLEAVNPELAKIMPQQDSDQVIPYLHFCRALIQGDYTGARRAITYAAHDNPARKAHWAVLADTLRLELSWPGAESELALGDPWQVLQGAARIAQPGSHCGVEETVNSHIITALGLLTRPLPAEYADLFEPIQRAKAAAQRAIHLAPWDIRTWFTLAQVGMAELFLRLHVGFPGDHSDEGSPGQPTGHNLELFTSQLASTLEWVHQRCSESAQSSGPSSNPWYTPPTAMVLPEHYKGWVHLWLSMTFLIRSTLNSISESDRQACHLRSYELAENVIRDLSSPYDTSNASLVALLALTQTQLARCLLVHDEVDEAFEHFHAALQVWKQASLDTHPLYLTTLLEVADYYGRRNKFRSAEDLFQGVVASIEPSGSPMVGYRQQLTCLLHWLKFALQFRQPSMIRKIRERLAAVDATIQERRGSSGESTMELWPLVSLVKSLLLILADARDSKPFDKLLKRLRHLPGVTPYQPRISEEGEDAIQFEPTVIDESTMRKRVPTFPFLQGYLAWFMVQGPSPVDREELLWYTKTELDLQQDIGPRWLTQFLKQLAQ